MNNNNTLLPLSFSSIHLYGLYNYCYELKSFYEQDFFKVFMLFYHTIFNHLLCGAYGDQLKFLRICIISSLN